MAAWNWKGWYRLTGYVLFRSAQAAAQADTVLRRKGLPVRLVPTPRQLSAECGTALSFEARCGLAAQVEAGLREAGVEFTAIHLLGCRPEGPDADPAQMPARARTAPGENGVKRKGGHYGP